MATNIFGGSTQAGGGHFIKLSRAADFVNYNLIG
jgi:hypothetical protein